jgi:hypothetical protein
LMDYVWLSRRSVISPKAIEARGGGFRRHVGVRGQLA